MEAPIQRRAAFSYIVIPGPGGNLLSGNTTLSSVNAEENNYPVTIIPGQITDEASFRYQLRFHGRSIMRLLILDDQANIVVAERRYCSLDQYKVAKVRLDGPSHNNQILSGRSTWASGGLRPCLYTMAPTAVEEFIRSLSFQLIAVYKARKVHGNIRNGVLIQEINADHLRAILYNMREPELEEGQAEFNWFEGQLKELIELKAMVREFLLYPNDNPGGIITGSSKRSLNSFVNHLPKNLLYAQAGWFLDHPFVWILDEEIRFMEAVYNFLIHQSRCWQFMTEIEDAFQKAGIREDWHEGLTGTLLTIYSFTSPTVKALPKKRISIVHFWRRAIHHYNTHNKSNKMMSRPRIAAAFKLANFDVVLKVREGMDHLMEELIRERKFSHWKDFMKQVGWEIPRHIRI